MKRSTKDRHAAYRQTEAYKISQKKYHSSDKCRAAVREAVKRYSKTELGSLKTKLRTIARREMEMAIDQKLTPDDIKFIFNKFKHQCFNCGSKQKLQIDHHYPLSLGHALSIKNAVVLCKSCNTSKGKKLPEAFYSQEKLCLLN